MPSLLSVPPCALTRTTTAAALRFAVLQPDVFGIGLSSVTLTQVRARHTRGGRHWITPDQPWKCTSARPIFEPYRGHYWGKRGNRRCLNPAIPDEVPEWNMEKKRTGLLAIKTGMVTLRDAWGAMIGCTVLKIDNCQVIYNKRVMKQKGIEHSVQVGCTNVKSSETKENYGHFKWAGVPVKKSLAEFTVSPDAHIPVGTQLGATHFIPGQLVNLHGRTKDKGFQGVMKRWGFKGGPATHGSSKFHRQRGSSGASGPGRVLPGTKMAGHMGDENRATLAVVVRIDAHLNLIYVKGPVFGPIGNPIKVRDAHVQGENHPRLFPDGAVPPYPTMTVDEYKLLGHPREVHMATVGRDPCNRIE